MKEIDSRELSEGNGQDGKPVYIAHQGKVFDVSESKLWKGGLHMKRHHAGKDLTTDIQGAPHGTEVLERYPQVAVLKKGEGAEREIPESLSRLLSRFPMLRRHPHPMTIHFPIVFMFSTTLFNLLYLLTGVRSFELTALNCLGAGILFTPVAMVTGYLYLVAELPGETGPTRNHQEEECRSSCSARKSSFSSGESRSRIS